MSTWQATVRADACFVVLMSGENAAEPTESEEGTVCIFKWHNMSFGRCVNTERIHLINCMSTIQALILLFFTLSVSAAILVF